MRGAHWDLMRVALVGWFLFYASHNSRAVECSFLLNWLDKYSCPHTNILHNNGLFIWCKLHIAIFIFQTGFKTGLLAGMFEEW